MTFLYVLVETVAVIVPLLLFMAMAIAAYGINIDAKLTALLMFAWHTCFSLRTSLFELPPAFLMNICLNEITSN